MLQPPLGCATCPGTSAAVGMALLGTISDKARAVRFEHHRTIDYRRPGRSADPIDQVVGLQPAGIERLLFQVACRTISPKRYLPERFRFGRKPLRSVTGIASGRSIPRPDKLSRKRKRTTEHQGLPFPVIPTVITLAYDRRPPPPGQTPAVLPAAGCDRCRR